MSLLPKVDTVDAQILAALRENARISHAKLGERVNLSRNAVRQRIERLERDDRIRGYTILEPTPDKTSVTATLLVDRVDRMRGTEVIARLMEFPEVVYCDVVAGELDIIVRIEAADSGAVQEVWQQVSDMSGVRNIVTAMSLRTVVNRRIHP